MDPMGRCHEFGSQIREGCGHPMRAGERACACPECGVVCQGLFDGCPDVWARGPRPIHLTNVAALGGNGTGSVRALNAGPELARRSASQQQAPPPPPPPPSRPSTTNGFRSSPPPPGAALDSRTEILQWFEDAFDDLRNELHAVVSTVTRQQAMLAELLDAREAELRVVVVAESLPELAGEAAAKALANESSGLAEVVADYLEEFRRSVEASELSSASVMDGMRELLQRMELTAEVGVEDAAADGAERLDALKASVARQLRPLAADIGALAAEAVAAEERDTARTRALKASLTKQIQPLADKLDAAIARSDRQLAEIHERLDGLAAPPARARSPRPAPTSPAKATGASRVLKAARPAPADPAPAPKPKLRLRPRDQT